MKRLKILILMNVVFSAYGACVKENAAVGNLLLLMDDAQKETIKMQLSDLFNEYASDGRSYVRSRISENLKELIKKLKTIMPSNEVIDYINSIINIYNSSVNPDNPGVPIFSKIFIKNLLEIAKN
ncbi:MAG: hypothetical protein P4L22_01135 [Candidatus Babeliales bacterium]|nr:hypothetical protein [Candidatus Babeliales bacterium]